jgi:hypothetical protein
LAWFSSELPPRSGLISDSLIWSFFSSNFSCMGWALGSSSWLALEWCSSWWAGDRGWRANQVPPVVTVTAERTL